MEPHPDKAIADAVSALKDAQKAEDDTDKLYTTVLDAAFPEVIRRGLTRENLLLRVHNIDALKESVNTACTKRRQAEVLVKDALISRVTPHLPKGFKVDFSSLSGFYPSIYISCPGYGQASIIFRAEGRWDCGFSRTDTLESVLAKISKEADAEIAEAKKRAEKSKTEEEEFIKSAAVPKAVRKLGFIVQETTTDDPARIILLHPKGEVDYLLSQYRGDRAYLTSYRRLKNGKVTESWMDFNTMESTYAFIVKTHKKKA